MSRKCENVIRRLLCVSTVQVKRHEKTDRSTKRRLRDIAKAPIPTAFVCHKLGELLKRVDYANNIIPFHSQRFASAGTQFA